MTTRTLYHAQPAPSYDPRQPVAVFPYQAFVIDAPAQFHALKAEWDEFVRQCGVHNLCMTHGWLMTWLDHFPPERLFVIIITDASGRWVGVAPLQIRKGAHGLTHRILRHVQWVGDHPTVYDWMKCIVHPEADEKAIIDLVASEIQRAHWDVLDLRFVSCKHQLTLLCQALRQPVHTAVRETMPIPYLPLPATEAEYEKIRPKKTRLEVNRHCNRFNKEFGAPLHLEFQPATEASFAILNRFFHGHIKYWSEKGSKSDFERFPHLFDFYKNVLKESESRPDDPAKPRLLFSVLKMNDYQLSYHLGFWQGNGYLSHITHFNQGFREYSPGVIHMDKLIIDTLRRGGGEFEMGRGDEPYKARWTRQKKSLWNLRVFRNPLSRGAWQMDIALKKLWGKPVE